MSYILVTGGCGYIGSHISVKLLELGHKIIIIDDLSMTGKIPLGLLYFLDFNSEFKIDPTSQLLFFNYDLKDPQIEQIFSICQINTVIHLAGFKSVKESILNPIKYYENNLSSTINLLKIMLKYKVPNIIFSSSATVYANNPEFLKETDPVDPSTPYGRTKLMIEEMIKDCSSINSIILRYFNPIGCHPLLPETPSAVPENLAPFILQVLKGKIPELIIFGNDYNTPDGTCIRDFIHINDLVDGHLASLDYLKNKPHAEIINLGTGKGYSILEMVQEFEKHGKPIAFKFGPRREGDLERVCADVSKAHELLGWSSKYKLKEMVKSLIDTLN